MTMQQILEEIKQWFESYCDKEITKGVAELQTRMQQIKDREIALDTLPIVWQDEALFRRNLELKHRHTIFVADNARMIAESLSFDQEEVALAQIVGYLHDAGRFPQLRRNGTFSDTEGENHAELAIQVFLEEGLDDWFSDEDYPLIEKAVGLHNAYRYDPIKNERVAIHTKIIRDADKLDIFRTITDENRKYGYTLKQEQKSGFNEALIQDVLNYKNLSYQLLKTKEDWMLFNIGLIFDINYPKSFQIIRGNKYVERMVRSYEGQHPLLPEIVNSTLSYIDQRISAI